jgi:hypothetical protein
MSSGATITRLRKKYQVIRLLETCLLGVGVGCFAWAACSWTGLSYLMAGIISFAALAAVIVFRVAHLKIFSLTDERMSFFLNEKFKLLQDSSELLITPYDQLSVLEQIQVNRTEKALESLSKIKLPHYLVPSLVFVAAGIVVVGLSGFAIGRGHNKTLEDQPVEQMASSSVQVEPELNIKSIKIQPPAYTKIKPSNTNQLSAVVPEGSLLTWTIGFTNLPEKVVLQFLNGDSATLSRDNDQFKASQKIEESLIYQVKWSSSTNKYLSDYFEIRVKADAAPVVAISGLQQFTRLSWHERESIDVPVLLRDDYGLSKGHIIATVSKGSGESVKFREETLPFDAPSSISGQEIKAHRRITFQKLGMEPGDEIYFYAEAWDNKQPNPQRTRTETYFVSLQDTANNAIVADASLGVDLMPDYFRSQRQIIIDTEKLLKDKPNISKQQFKSTSNELGYDQKVLRLKYGQFLGEEFETAIGPQAHEESADNDEEDPTKTFGHQHDKENEHNLVAEKKPEAGHEHEGEEDENDPMAAFKHNHDNMEEATFFTQSVRSKLKAALTLMWDAELQLRLFEPKASLPIQYKILNLLKEISQDSRIYVHRMGFDPPPLKEEKRLTGDLAEINNMKALGAATGTKPYPAIRKALTSVNAAIQADVSVANEALKADLREAAIEIGEVAINSPGSYLVHLSLIRSIIDGTIHPSEYKAALREIQAACWKILPYEHEGPGQQETTRHPIDEQLLKELKSESNE